MKGRVRERTSLRTRGAERFHRRHTSHSKVDLTFCIFSLNHKDQNKLNTWYICSTTNRFIKSTGVKAGFLVTSPDNVYLFCVNNIKLMLAFWCVSSTGTGAMNHNISIDDLIGNVDPTKFYRYMGSLTTPDCSESVVWTVFQDPINVHTSLVSQPRSVY